MSMIQRPSPPSGGFSARHLGGVDDLCDADLDFVLSLTAYYAGCLRHPAPVRRRLEGRTQVNLFFEDSTRTNLSFDLAGRKLGADVVNVPVSASSVHKGETVSDTVRTMAAMGADVIVVRTGEGSIPVMPDGFPGCAMVNGGAGTAEHPTQALLDAATAISVFGSLEGRIVAICGDIARSRVAGSNARLMTRLGAQVRFAGPAYFMPDAHVFGDIPRFHTLREGLAGADIVMVLRIQSERAAESETCSVRDYARTFGLTRESLEFAKPDARIMHPGPMNRGVEIDGALADDPERSLVLRQVFYGVAARMAVLDALLTGGSI